MDFKGLQLRNSGGSLTKLEVFEIRYGIALEWMRPAYM